MTSDGSDAVRRAKDLIEAEQFDEAIGILEPWLEDNPEDAAAWSALGAAYFELEDYEAAAPAARKAVELRPESAREWCNLGTVLRKLGRLEEAANAQRRALAVEQDYDRALMELEKLGTQYGMDEEMEPVPQPSGKGGAVMRNGDADREARDSELEKWRNARRREEVERLNVWAQALTYGIAFLIPLLGVIWGGALRLRAEGSELSEQRLDDRLTALRYIGWALLGTLVYWVVWKVWGYDILRLLTPQLDFPWPQF
ncbi:MAG: tetratricopeptide repeat protein [Armatimonadota bacterium]|nr:tetratricopeptide repeat protein [Armatimonadota bacterium]